MSNPRKQVFKAAEYQNRLSVQREVIEDSENTMVAKVAALEPRFEHGFSYISIYVIVPLGTGAAMRVSCFHWATRNTVGHIISSLVLYTDSAGVVVRRLAKLDM